MTKPVRIQLQRTRGWRMPPNTTSVTRAGMFGNPFPVDVYGAEGAVDRFRRWLAGNMSALEMSQSSRADRWSSGPNPISLVQVRRWLLDELPRLKGRNLACFCKLDQPWCHVTVLLELANPEPRAT